MRVRPFKGVRPRPEIAGQVASLPYDVYSEEEARNIVDRNPESFLSIVRPETLFPLGTDPYSDEVYQRARELINENIEKGVFEEDKRDCFYIYREIMNGRAQTGLVACFSVDDYLNNNIKRHEFTRQDKEDDRTRHINVCSANTGLVFLAFKDGDDARKVLEESAAAEPLYNFVSVDNVTQMVWKVDDPVKVARIEEAFAGVPAMYIADGHHRTASAATVAGMRRADNPDYTGEEEYNFFMAVAFPAEQLLVMPYYRVVKDLNGMTGEEFLERLGERFVIEKKDLTAYEPAHHGEVAMFLDDVWYKMTAKPEFLKDDAIGSLGVSMVQENILEPLLGITDIRTSDRIDFIGGIRGLAELEKRCHEDMRVAFATRHTTVEQLTRVADEGKVMPPKSTWFEPKLQSGLFVHRI